MKKVLTFSWIALFTGFQSLSFSYAEAQQSTYQPEPKSEKPEQPIEKGKQCDPENKLKVPAIIF